MYCSPGCLTVLHSDSLHLRDYLLEARLALLDDVHQAARTERALELPQVCVDYTLDSPLRELNPRGGSVLLASQPA